MAVRINLRDIIEPGDAVTVTFDDASTLVGVFQSWREDFKFMEITETTNTHVILNYNYFTVTT
jgi:hypothetical protein